MCRVKVCSCLIKHPAVTTRMHSLRQVLHFTTNHPVILSN